MYGFYPSGAKFIADASCTGKKIQYGYMLPIELVLKDVKQGLFGSVGGGSYRKLLRRGEFSAFVYSRDDTHRSKKINEIGCRMLFSIKQQPFSFLGKTYLLVVTF
jgi:hypothetical protein